MLLQEKNAIIYGASGDVGSAIARAFAREGARLFLVGRTLSTLDVLARDIVAGGGRGKNSPGDRHGQLGGGENAPTGSRQTGPSHNALTNAPNQTPPGIPAI